MTAGVVDRVKLAVAVKQCDRFAADRNLFAFSGRDFIYGGDFGEGHRFSSQCESTDLTTTLCKQWSWSATWSQIKRTRPVKCSNSVMPFRKMARNKSR